MVEEGRTSFVDGAIEEGGWGLGVERLRGISGGKSSQSLPFLAIAIETIDTAEKHFEMAMANVPMMQVGDRISRNSVTIFRSVLHENKIYSMKNFIVQEYGKSVRTTPHKYKSSFYMKTYVSSLSSKTFPFSPFSFMKYEVIESMAMA
ncbi:hypothetical protein Ahy_B10g104900 [Arachis hypogaea]|uniref:Replication protein A 70 kDa DNA-binding subunit B/D first OB fold domain-containing protein n=1 Tax=Arachis hypogaea TaxID=3818 RepID=A0A444X6P0_ARAHY|nr:hypothetical protein Ahy_B10g104900 [Arachis hypogaea]